MDGRVARNANRRDGERRKGRGEQADTAYLRLVGTRRLERMTRKTRGLGGAAEWGKQEGAGQEGAGQAGR